MIESMIGIPLPVTVLTVMLFSLMAFHRRIRMHLRPVMMMSFKPPKNLLAVARREKQCGKDEQKTVVAKTSHWRSGSYAHTVGPVKKGVPDICESKPEWIAGPRLLNLRAA